jgi:glycosyltransferase involved in cell wall biosynthesis
VLIHHETAVNALFRQPMVILHISPFLQYFYGGGEVATLDLIAGLDEPCRVVCLAGGTAQFPFHCARTSLVPIPRLAYEHRFLSQRLKRVLLFFPSATQDRYWERVLWRRFRDEFETSDLIHCHGIHWFLPCRRIAQRLGKPIVLTAHDVLPRELFPGQTNRFIEALILRRLAWQRAEFAAALPKAAAVVTVSEFCAGTLRRFVPGANVVMIYNWLQSFSPAPPAPCGAPRLVYIGRLSREKGVDLLLKAFGRDITLITTGGPLEKQVRRTHPLLRLPHDRVVSVMRDHGLVIVPSRFNEPFGLVCLEARQAGVKIVASTAGGIPEILAGYPNASLVPHDLPEDRFVEALRQAASQARDAPLYRASDSEFLEKFSRQTGLRRHRVLYESLRAGKPA